MEINFLFLFNGKTVNRILNPNQIIEEVLEKILKEDKSKKNSNSAILLCNGNSINKLESFKKNKIKNGDVIMVNYNIEQSQIKTSNTLTEESFVKFKVHSQITMHAHVNLENSDLNAFIDKTFDIFRTITNEYILVYAYSENYKNYSLIFYDIIKNKNINIIKNAHEERVFTCNHFFNQNKKSDLLLTGSFDKTIQIRNLNNNYELIFKITPDYLFNEKTYLLSETLLFYDNEIYLITSAYEIYSSGYNILYYNILNNNKGQFSNSKNNTNFLGIYYNKNIPYIIAANCGNIKLFNFINKKLKYTYTENKNINYLSVIIKEYKKELCLFASSADGNIKIWIINHPENLFTIINSYSNNWLIGLKLINKQILLATCSDGCLKAFDLNKGYMIFSMKREKIDPLFTVKYVNITGNNYLFTHSHKGFIEMWKKIK